MGGIDRRLQRLESGRKGRERGPWSTPEAQAGRERAFGRLYAELRELGAPATEQEDEDPFGRLFGLIERHRKETEKGARR